MKFEHLSPNLLIVVNKLLENQDLMKLVYYNTLDALSQPDISNPEIVKPKIYPYPYNGVLTEQQTQIRVYYGNTKIKNRVVETTPVLFEIITHSNLYLINDPNGRNNEKLLRLYEIANRVTELFDEVSVNTVGKLRFTDITPVMGLPEGYQMIRLIGEMLTIGK